MWRGTVPPVRMPMVDTGKGEALDVMSKLLEDRIIILGGDLARRGACNRS